MGKSRKSKNMDEMVQELIACGEDDNIDPGTLQPTDNEVNEAQEQYVQRPDPEPQEEESSGWGKVIGGCALAVGLFGIGYLVYKTFCGPDDSSIANE